MHDSIIQLPKYAKVGFAILCIMFATLLAVTAIHRYRYPYGRRPGGISLPGMYSSLVAYAGEHNGWFPNSEKDSYDALRQLYDSYCPSGEELAGVSGNIVAVTDALRKGIPLNASLTSWVYVPGFRIDDPQNTAMLWESKPSVFYDGRRNDFGGRAVLLIGGDITNVPAVDWENFLKQQEQLRKAIQTNRKPVTHSPPPDRH